MSPVVLTHSEAETMDVGRTWAATLRPGAVLLLHGDLGAGKTAFVRGVAQGLGIDPDTVSSPTFTLIQEYRGGRLLLRHVDLYRLRAAEVDDLGLDELTMGDVVTAIEWPDRLPRSMAGAMTVRIEHTDGDDRRITLPAYSER